MGGWWTDCAGSRLEKLMCMYILVSVDSKSPWAPDGQPVGCPRRLAKIMGRAKVSKSSNLAVRDAV
jgi:hypothetical protein